MLDDKKLKEIESRVKQYLKEGIITTKGKKEFVDFFLKNARDSLESAKVLYDLSVDIEKQGVMGLTDFNGLLWAVNASYYSNSRRCWKQKSLQQGKKQGSAASRSTALKNSGGQSHEKTRTAIPNAKEKITA